MMAKVMRERSTAIRTRIKGGIFLLFGAALIVGTVLPEAAFGCDVTSVTLWIGGTQADAEEHNTDAVSKFPEEEFGWHVHWYADGPDIDDFYGEIWLASTRVDTFTAGPTAWYESGTATVPTTMSSGNKTVRVWIHRVYGEWDCSNPRTLTVVEVDNVAICKPTGDDWAELPWAQVLLRGETLRVKAGINPSLPTGADFTIDVTVRTSSTNPTGITVTLDELADSGSVLRGTTSTSSLIDSGGGGSEFTSADKATEEASNFNDSDQFDSDMSSSRTQRGKARNGGNESASPPEGGVSKTFMQAAGVEYIEVIYDEGEPGEKKDKNQIENQADNLYFSGHGSHDTGGVSLYPSGSFGPSDVSGGKWESDLGMVFLATCAVFDVDDLNYNYSETNDEDDDGIKDHDESPGEAWATKGPNYFMGYNYISPLDHWHGDPQFTAKIIHKWYSDTEHSLFEAWGQANKYYADGLDDRPYNACVIDARWSPKTYWYWKKGTFYHTWEDYSF